MFMKKNLSLLFFPVVFILFGCSPAPRYGRVPSERSTRKVTPPHTEKSAGSFSFYQRGGASFYGERFHGRQTANGEIYDMNKHTAAHKKLPFNSIVRVTNLNNNKSVIVRINDRGPFVKGRVIDLSYGAAKAVGMIQDGVVPVQIEVQRQ